MNQIKKMSIRPSLNSLVTPQHAEASGIRACTYTYIHSRTHTHTRKYTYKTHKRAHTRTHIQKSQKSPCVSELRVTMTDVRSLKGKASRRGIRRIYHQGADVECKFEAVASRGCTLRSERAEFKMNHIKKHDHTTVVK